MNRLKVKIEHGYSGDTFLDLTMENMDESVAQSITATVLSLLTEAATRQEVDTISNDSDNLN